jgi:2-C-methyl-D-erythritol 4-phosphate cytidylyltransferase
MKYDVIILAAGSGKRMGAGRNKVLLEVSGKPVIQYSVDLFQSDPDCQQVILVGKSEERDLLAFPDTTFVVGGAERQDSVRNALEIVESPYVMIHDGARPFVTQVQLDELKRVGNGILAVQVKDTIKAVTDLEIDQTVPRENLWGAQTPQMFESSLIRSVHQLAFESDYLGTDDASLVEQFAPSVSLQIVPGSYYNIKLTTPEDLLFGEAIAGQLKEA